MPKYELVPPFFYVSLQKNLRGLMQYLLGLFFTAIVLFQCQQRTLSGTVIKVADGDTFTMLTDQNQQVRVRLHGIDAPEKNQEFSRTSKNYLTELVMHKVVEVVPRKKDQYGRVVAVVYVEQLAVNEAMLKAGLAWHFTEFDSNSDWHNMESAARRKRIGIWSQPDPVPPWEFRKANRRQRQR
jgi:micrococcal nuclease